MLLASNSLHNPGGQKNHAHVTTQRILNKFIGIKFSIGCMVWPRCCLFQHSTTMSFINEDMQPLRFKAFSLLFFNEKERECVAQVHDASGENAIMWCKVVEGLDTI